MEYSFNKVADKKFAVERAPLQMFACDFWENFHSIFFEEHLLTATSAQSLLTFIPGLRTNFNQFKVFSQSYESIFEIGGIANTMRL